MTDKVYLVDGSGYIFRAYYAVQPLSTKNGFPTNALYGFTRMLLKLIENSGDHIIMFFDAGRETFRNELYSEYKANRSECPEDLVPQMPYFRKISESLGLKVIEQVGFEADDLIGTFSEHLSKLGLETVIVSADKDLMQLVNDHVSIWDSMKEKQYQAPQVYEKFGVQPEQMIDFLTLMGDSSDNIPGVRGVGPKTAAVLINKYKTVEDILSSIDSIKEDKEVRGRKKIAETIEEDPEIVRLSKQLVTIKTDCNLNLELEQNSVELNASNLEQVLEYARRHEVDRDNWEKLTEELEFQFQVDNLSQKKKKEADANYQCVLKKDFPTWLEEFKKVKEFAFDLETDSLDILSANIVGAAFCWGDNKAFYIPFAHLESKDAQVDLETFISELKTVFENNQVQVIGQNIKYDLNVLARYNFEIKEIAFDTMLAAYLLNPDGGGYNLSRLAKDYLGLDSMDFTEATEGLDCFSQVDLQTATHYAAQDAHYTWLLKSKLEPEIKKEKLEKVLHQIEEPLVISIAQMERNGIKLDTEMLAKMSEDLGKKLEDLIRTIEDLAGESFNLNSPKQLQYILFEKLQIPTKGLKKTKTGISTNAVTLEKLADVHELPAKILEYRELFKLKSTYVDALPGHISSVTSRLHGSFNQTITATGRLSSSNPNLQNIPIQSSVGREIRKAFIAEPGNLLISADYSQVELRVLAHLSSDQNLINAFADDLDIHAQTASEILGIDLKEVTPEDRRMGKVINFGIIYGMSGFRLGRELGLSFGVATQYINDYFDYYSKVSEYFKQVEKQLETDGYVETLLGRKRYIASIDTAGRDKGFLVRAALNAPVQGTAADIIKLAMINIDKKIKEQALSYKMILQVHDELLFEVPESQAEQACDFIKDEMEKAFPLKVPLKVGTGIGPNWGLIH